MARSMASSAEYGHPENARFGLGSPAIPVAGSLPVAPPTRPIAISSSTGPCLQRDRAQMHVARHFDRTIAEHAGQQRVADRSCECGREQRCRRHRSPSKQVREPTRTSRLRVPPPPSSSLHAPRRAAVRTRWRSTTRAAFADPAANRSGALLDPEVMKNPPVVTTAPTWRSCAPRSQALRPAG